MILFYLFAAYCFYRITFANDTDGLFYRLKYSIRSNYPVRRVLKDIGEWIGDNILFGILSAGAALVVSFVAFVVLVMECPKEPSQWEFKINALQDNLVTEGNFYYGGRGHVDGELSYFYSRTLSMGEKIEHIPANKTYIKYSEDEQPHVEVHQSRIDIPDWAYKVFWLGFMNPKGTDYYVIVVPEGSITNIGQYEIDMR